MGTVERKGPITAVLHWAEKAWPLHSCPCQSLGVGRPGEGVQTRQEAPVEGSLLMALPAAGTTSPFSKGSGWHIPESLEKPAWLMEWVPEDVKEERVRAQGKRSAWDKGRGISCLMRGRRR